MPNAMVRYAADRAANHRASRAQFWRCHPLSTSADPVVILNGALQKLMLAIEQGSEISAKLRNLIPRNSFQIYEIYRSSIILDVATLRTS